MADLIIMEEVVKFLKECGAYFLATVDGDQPKVRPSGTAEIFEGKLYIQTGKVKNVSKQIAANPKVQICAMNKAEDSNTQVLYFKDADATFCSFTAAPCTVKF